MKTETITIHLPEFTASAKLLSNGHIGYELMDDLSQEQYEGISNKINAAVTKELDARLMERLKQGELRLNPGEIMFVVIRHMNKLIQENPHYEKFYFMIYSRVLCLTVNANARAYERYISILPPLVMAMQNSPHIPYVVEVLAKTMDSAAKINETVHELIASTKKEFGFNQP